MMLPVAHRPECAITEPSRDSLEHAEVPGRIPATVVDGTWQNCDSI